MRRFASTLFIPLLFSGLGCRCGSKKVNAELPGAVAGSSSEEVTPPPPPLPANAPRLAAIAQKAIIYEKPDDKSRILGYLRLGADVARAEKPVSGPGCQTYYQVSPRGYICVDDKGATLDLQHKILKALGTKPDLSKPMPYTYGFVRRDATLWHYIPNHKEMDKNEYAFQGHLKEYAKHKEAWNRIDKPNPNDVPLDEQGNPTTLPKEVPPMRPQPEEGKLFPLYGDGSIPWWLVNSNPGYKRTTRRHIPNVSSFEAIEKLVTRGKAYRHAGLAVIGSIQGDKSSDNRRWVVLLDGRLIAEDKIKPHHASSFHGMKVDASMFPFGIIRRRENSIYTSPSVKTSHKATFRDVVPLSGKSTLHNNKMYWQTKDGNWFMEDHIAVFTGQADPPKTFKWKEQKWIDVSITYQTLTLYEGEKPVYATLVSTGVDGDGDPKTTKSTVRGEFRIDTKHVTSTMDADDPENRFELRDVPWVQFFEQAFALHAAYWHDDFGRMRSHGCVNMSPVDARRVFMWTDPPVPEGWHGVKSGGQNGPGTVVRVRR
jgi:hypothetical protein